MTAEAFELAEFFQTPVIMLTDLDLGMNDHVCAPLKWNDSKPMNRGKVLNAEDLDKVEKWGRYLDIDGDGVPYRTYPGTHPTKGSYFTRGTSRDEFAVYTEESEAYVRNMQRLELKWETMKSRVPAPEFYQQKNENEYGLIFFGTSIYAAKEAIDLLAAEGLKFDAMRLRSFPFNTEVDAFINSHKKVFLIEQNRDAQMKSLLVNELQIDPKNIISILNYDGMPITADHIMATLKSKLNMQLS
jgi:2-oxoglutarate ferredoxin oxidoreductase subunit alpha